MTSLYDYQVTGKDFLKEGLVRMLADDMGLGKSCQALFAAKELDDVQEIAIVCPAILQFNWQEEIDKWGIAKTFTIISYSSLHKLPDIPYDLVIFDEWHNAKNPKAKRTRLAMTLAQKTKRAWCLTGTPFPNGCANEIYTFLILAGFRGSWWSFCRKFCKEKTFRVKRRTVRQYYKGQNLKQLKALLDPHMLRRKKRDVLHMLPEKTHNTVYLGVESSQKYKPYADRLRDAIHGERLNKEETEHIATLRRELGISKISKAIRYISTVKEDYKDPVLLFTYHRDVALSLTKELRLKHFKAEMILGGMTQSNKELVIRNFKEGKVDILVLSMKAASEGLNLTEASKVFFVELPWNPATLDQCIGRIDRIGQESAMDVYFLLQKNSFDDVVKRTILGKRKVSYELVG